MEEEHEFDGVSREAAATVLRQLADGVVGGSVRIGEEQVALPERLDVEVEYEGEDDDREIEVELAWSAATRGGAAEAIDEASADVEEAEEGDRDRAPGVDVVADEVGEPVEDAGVEGEAGVAEETEESGMPTSVTEIVGPGETTPSGSGARFEVFEDRAGEWRWRLVHANGNVIADSGEGYSRKANARKGLRSVQANAPGAEVVEE